MTGKQFLTSTQAAAYLGVSRPTLYKLVEQNEVAHYKMLSHLRFNESDLDEYLARARTPSRYEKNPASKKRSTKRSGRKR